MERILRGNHKALLIAPKWPGRVWFPILQITRQGAVVPPCEAGTPLTAGGSNLAPEPSLSAAWGLASEGPEPLLGSCDPAVVRTIHSSRAPSTNALYANRWRFFL